jgi:parvulin-like peptidyl-prolyl isomerase
MPHLVRARVGLISLLCVAAVATGCGDGDGSDRDAPQASDIPADAVAVVGSQPIARKQLQERIGAVRRSQREGTASAEQVRQQALSLLLQESVIEQEAEERGVRVTNAEIRQRLTTAKRQFRSGRQYRRFLGRQTEADLLRQLRMQVLSEKVLADVRETGGDAEEFFEQLQQRSKDSSICREGYIVAGCGNAR